jgi:hypothetical protein
MTQIRVFVTQGVTPVRVAEVDWSTRPVAAALSLVVAPFGDSGGVPVMVLHGTETSTRALHGEGPAR